MDKITLLMEKLNCSEAEAIDIIEKDKKIEKGGNPFPLSAEQAKISKKARITTTGKSKTGNRKEKPIRRNIIDTISKVLVAEYGVPILEIVNPERIIEFYIDDTKYRLVLSAPTK